MSVLSNFFTNLMSWWNCLQNSAKKADSNIKEIEATSILKLTELKKIGKVSVQKSFIKLPTECFCILWISAYPENGQQA